ncbi:MAG TPA: 4Fe-4S dicluster domain-containing protein [Bryobacteraceae bacterium]|nr:4Fe-4S dicluster domain-containing protein [Bryobacteraceae bacterium]
MSAISPETLKEMGVVGAGGAGFPTYVKAASKVEFVLANGAECEPLLHKDFELMCRYPAEICAGMTLMMEATGAANGKFGLKEKNQAAVNAIGPEAHKRGFDLVLLGDFYPSGDEYELVYSATGRLIPPAGIPLQVGCVVNNVETFYNLHQASEHQLPVTRKFLSVTGTVGKPQSLWAPIGTSFRDLIAHCGGATVSDFGMFVSGIMMGTLSYDLDDVVTRTTGGLILLPKSHYLFTRKDRPLEDMNRIGKSACDQCSYCTEFCPRFLLGYDIQPHKVMRSLGFTLTGASNWNQWGELCCACGICTLYACPEELYPKEACDQAKTSLRQENIKFIQQKPVKVHPMKEYRRLPLSMLRQRLQVESYECETPFQASEPAPFQVRIKLKQHAGQPAVPIVKEGDTVRLNQPIARVGENDLGVTIHSSVNGSIHQITRDAIEIWR